jgi:AcrR family transcriptional regulator
MPSSDRRARQREQVRNRILAAARGLFARHGFEAVTLRKIAAEIDYVPGAIYVHFHDKEELIRTLCLADFDSVTKTVAPMAKIADPIDRIRRMGRAYVTFALEHPNSYRLLFMQASPYDHDARALERRGDPRRDGYAFLKLAAQQAIEQGRMRREFKDPELVAETFWAAVHGVASIEINFSGDKWVAWRPIRRRTEAMLDAILAGMCVELVKKGRRP